MAKTIPMAHLRRNLAQVLSYVADRRHHLVLTRSRRPIAVLVPIDEYHALEETVEILSDRDALTALQAGLKELARGHTIDFDDLRGELAQVRPPT
jgi:antitoxin YefM